MRHHAARGLYRPSESLVPTLLPAVDLAFRRDMRLSELLSESSLITCLRLPGFAFVTGLVFPSESLESNEGTFFVFGLERASTIDGCFASRRNQQEKLSHADVSPRASALHHVWQRAAFRQNTCSLLLGCRWFLGRGSFFGNSLFGFPLNWWLWCRHVIVRLSCRVPHRKSISLGQFSTFLKLISQLSQENTHSSTLFQLVSPLICSWPLSSWGEITHLYFSSKKKKKSLDVKGHLTKVFVASYSHSFGGRHWRVHLAVSHGLGGKTGIIIIITGNNFPSWRAGLSPVIKFIFAVRQTILHSTLRNGHLGFSRVFFSTWVNQQLQRFVSSQLW